jgi:inhibitor of KinA
MPTDGATLDVRWVSDRALRISLGEGTSAAVARRVLSAFTALRVANIDGAEDIVPAYATVVVTFSLRDLDARRTERAVREAIGRGEDVADAAPRTVEIPVCYDPEFALDLEEVARLHGTLPEEVVRLHSSAEYVVRFLGFSPGFPYLGGLPKELATPRLAQPRVRVPAGSVAIAGEQAGIYPASTAGGWRILGRTPIAPLEPRRRKPALLEPGDRVRLVRIERADYDALVVR